MNIWKDFYPTPVPMIKQLLKHVKLESIKYILDPSGGKGDLLEFLNASFYAKQFKMDAIEINPELRIILKGKGFNVIADDFLIFDTFKKYDLLILNPPFSNGDLHLLKAIEMIEKTGGQIACLLNAETLKNPFSNNRKLLLRKLEDHGAIIDYVQNAFVEAERTTGVETAVIYINIKATSNSVIFENLKAHVINDDNNTENGTIINTDPISSLVDDFNFEIKCGVQLIRDYEYLNRNIIKEEGYYGLSLKLKDVDITFNSFIEHTRLKYWKCLFDSNTFAHLLTLDLKQKYQAEIERMRDFDFTLYNINQLKLEISSKMCHSLEATILRLFDDLSHKVYYSESSKNIHLFNGWKTNKSWKINQRVIFRITTTNWYHKNDFDLTQSTIIDKLRDIEKVMNYLTTEFIEDIDIYATLKKAQENGCSKNIKLKHFNVTFFKKGTCHLVFSNENALKRFNIFGSQKKGWLPPSYGKSDIKDMAEEDKSVILSFQTEKEYQDVLSNPSKFMFNSSTLLLTA